MPVELGFVLGLLTGILGCFAVMSGRRPVTDGAPEAADDVVGSAERELATRRLAAENAALITQMAEVRERLATLERLAVDRTSRLADEIEALRA
jgi:hypothetical protein